MKTITALLTLACLNIGVHIVTNVQESGASFTTVETEASNENVNRVWVRSQRNRGTMMFLQIPFVAFLW